MKFLFLVHTLILFQCVQGAPEKYPKMGKMFLVGYEQDLNIPFKVR